MSKLQHSRCKKGVAATQKALLKRCKIKMGGQGLMLFTGLKLKVMMTSLHNIVISGAKGYLIDWIKTFDKDDRAAKVKIKEKCFAWSSLSKILIPST